MNKYIIGIVIVVLAFAGYSYYESQNPGSNNDDNGNGDDGNVGVCSDTDYGDKPTIPGKVSISGSPGIAIDWCKADYWDGNGRLVEYSCDNGEVRETTYMCNGKCYPGEDQDYGYCSPDRVLATRLI